MDFIHGGIIEEEEEQAISHYSPLAYIYIYHYTTIPVSNREERKCT
jgi:hypothetical protein